MSSVGFVPGAVKELEQLREAWKTLNDLLKNLANAEACLQKHDLQLTADYELLRTGAEQLTVCCDRLKKKSRNACQALAHHLHTLSQIS